MKLAEIKTAGVTITSCEGGQKALKTYNPHYSFYCDELELTTLKGVPDVIGQDFDCGENNLKSLQYGPTQVGGDYFCTSCLLTSLKGAPQKLNGFHCQHNDLSSLKGAPQEVNDFNCHHNNLTSLEGGPITVVCNYNCDYNKLRTLKGAPGRVLGFQCCGNELTSLEGAPKHTNYFNGSLNELTSLKGIHKHIIETHNIDFTSNPIKSHILGLLKIEGLRWVEREKRAVADNDKLDKAVRIINKHLQGSRNIFDCQAELEDAGLEEFAQL